MTVQLMLTCLCDALYGEVGIAAVRVLEHAGVRVKFPEQQTCCGQPPFNAGDWQTAREVTLRTLSLFDPEIPIVVPSASCAAMLRHGVGLLELKPTAHRIFELSEYLVGELEIRQWPLRGSPPNRRQRLAFHQSCHGRMIHLGDTQRRVLEWVPGVELMEFAQPEQCCGFGGSFAATHPHLSREMGREKLRWLGEASPDRIVSGDMGCLLHLKSLAAKEGVALATAHYAQILAEALS